MSMGEQGMSWGWRAGSEMLDEQVLLPQEVCGWLRLQAPASVAAARKKLEK